MKRALSEPGTSAHCCASAPCKRRRTSQHTAHAATGRRGILGWICAVSEAATEAHTAAHLHHQRDMMADPVRPTRLSPTRWEHKVRHRKRSVSPTKKPVEYRGIYLSEAAVLIDHCHELPAVLDLDAIVLSPAQEAAIAQIADDYCNSCRDLAKDGVGEGNWDADIVGAVMRRLARLSPWNDVLKMNASDKPWLVDLKPVRATLEPKPPRALPLPMPPPISLPSQVPEPKQSSALSPGIQRFSSASFTSNDAVFIAANINRRAADDFDTDTLSISTDTMSTSISASTTLTDADDDPEALSTPKPDLSVSLAHTWFATRHQRVLGQRSLRSDPHQAKMGMHFPFLIFEAKDSGNLFGAQNQAAVGAACMMRILNNIGCAQQIVFSVTTEGPVHELWIHHRVDEKYHSTFVDIWRMTARKGALQFIETLARIMAWGAGPFAQRVLSLLDALETVAEPE